MFVACPPDKAGWPHTYPGQWVIHQWEPRNLPKYHDTHVSSSFCHFTRLFQYLNFCCRLPHNSLLSLTSLCQKCESSLYFEALGRLKESVTAVDTNHPPDSPLVSNDCDQNFSSHQTWTNPISGQAFLIRPLTPASAAKGEVGLECEI